MLALLALIVGLQPGMVRIAGGEFTPLYAMPGQPVVQVAAFAMDTVPVSEARFSAFAKQHPRWRVRGMGTSASKPATRVSWAAAAAYCSARGARLPTTFEWEYAARADEQRADGSGQADFRQRALELAISARSRAYRIGTGLRNLWGVRDLHGGVMEWTHDYDAHLGRHHGHGARLTHCASGTVQTGDPRDYAAYIRYAYRTHETDGSGGSNVGFRCALSL